jgi:hypothetical protein
MGMVVTSPISINVALLGRERGAIHRNPPGIVCQTSGTREARRTVWRNSDEQVVFNRLFSLEEQLTRLGIDSRQLVERMESNPLGFEHLLNRPAQLRSGNRKRPVVPG